MVSLLEWNKMAKLCSVDCEQVLNPMLTFVDSECTTSYRSFRSKFTCVFCIISWFLFWCFLVW